MKLYNTLTRRKQEFKTADGSNTVRMYSCGPTVYNYAHIGNLRTYVFMDLLRRVLKYEGYKDVEVVDVEEAIVRMKEASEEAYVLANYTSLQNARNIIRRHAS